MPKASFNTISSPSDLSSSSDSDFAVSNDVDESSSPNVRSSRGRYRTCKPRFFYQRSPLWLTSFVASSSLLSSDAQSTPEGFARYEVTTTTTTRTKTKTTRTILTPLPTPSKPSRSRPNPSYLEPLASFERLTLASSSPSSPIAARQHHGLVTPQSSPQPRHRSYAESVTDAVDDYLGSKAAESDSDESTPSPSPALPSARRLQLSRQTPPVRNTAAVAGSFVHHKALSNTAAQPNFTRIQQQTPRPFAGEITYLAQTPVEAVGAGARQRYDEEAFRTMNVPPHPLELERPTGYVKKYFPIIKGRRVGVFCN